MSASAPLPDSTDRPEEFSPDRSAEGQPDWLDLDGYSCNERKKTTRDCIDPKTKKIRKTHSEWEVSVSLAQPSSRCIFCDKEGCLRTLRTNQQSIRDQSVRGIPCVIKVDRPYYLCTECRQRWSELLPHIDVKRDMTDRLRNQVWDDSFRKSHALIEIETGLDEKTIRQIQRDGFDALDKTRKIKLPEHMYCDEINLSPKKRFAGIDLTISVQRRVRASFGDGDYGRVIELFERCDLTLIARFFSQFTREELAGVKRVSMDLSEFFDSVTRKCLPGVTRIADHYHVKKLINAHFDEDFRVRLGNENVSEALVAATATGITNTDELRTIEAAAKKDAKRLCDHRFIMLKKPGNRQDQEKLNLEMICLAHDILKQAVAEKDALFMLWEETEDSKPKARKYKIKSADDARTAFAAWMAGLAEKTRPYWQPLINSFERWSTEIFSFFDHPITNSPAETGNSIMRAQNQRGRDYGFPSIRGKALYRDVRGEDVPWEGEDKNDPTAASRARTFEASKNRRKQAEARRGRIEASHEDAIPSPSALIAPVAQRAAGDSIADTPRECTSGSRVIDQSDGRAVVQAELGQEREGILAHLDPKAEKLTSDEPMSSADSNTDNEESTWTCPFDSDCMILRCGNPCTWCHHVQSRPVAAD